MTMTKIRGAEIGAAALGLPCPYCRVDADTPCRKLDAGCYHKPRREAALVWLKAQINHAALHAEQFDAKYPCQCRNHLGKAKARYANQAAGLVWMVRHGKERGIDGMRFETYRCPTSKYWHIRTARSVGRAGKADLPTPQGSASDGNASVSASAAP